MSGLTNVFEWCWEHSRTEGDDRKLLLWLAFQDEHPGHRPALPSLAALGTVIDMPWSRISFGLDRLIDQGELAITQDGPVTYYSFPAYEAARAPHTLILSTWDGEPYDGEDAHIWDHAELICPHQPPTDTMPCAVWKSCGCRATPPGRGTGTERCGRSSTGMHRYFNDRPPAVMFCWTQDWIDRIADWALDLGLQPGTHLVRPWWDGDQLRLETVEPQAVRHG